MRGFPRTFKVQLFNYQTFILFVAFSSLCFSELSELYYEFIFVADLQDFSNHASTLGVLIGVLMGAISSHPLNLLTCRYLPHFQRGIAYPAFLHTLSKVKLTQQIIQVFLPVTGFAIIASLYLTIGQFVASPIPCLGWLGKTKYLILEEVHFFTICKSFRRRETAFHGVLTIHNYD